MCGLSTYFCARSFYLGLPTPPFTAWHSWQPLVHALLVLLTVYHMWWSARLYNRDVASGLLAAQLCPSCGYALSAIPPEPDGCSVCPECGAAWRRAALGSTRRERARPRLNAPRSCPKSVVTNLRATQNCAESAFGHTSMCVTSDPAIL